MSKPVFIEIPATNKSIGKRKLVNNIFINDVDYITNITIDGKRLICKIYAMWRHLINKSSKEYQEKHPTYKGCTIHKDWVRLSSFRSWVIKQDWKGKDLDKDLKVLGNKEYSPDTCLFIDQNINKLMTDKISLRGICKIGVCFHKSTGKYQSNCNDGNGNIIYLGLFKTEEEAHQEWRKYKKSVAFKLSNKPENLYIKQYLINYANSI